MRSEILVVIVSIIGLLNGCASDSEAHIASDISSESNSASIKARLPEWVMHPPEGYKAVVSIVPPQKAGSSAELQQRAAIINARAMLAQNRSSYIKSMSSFTQTRNKDNEVHSSMESQTMVTSIQSLSLFDAEVIESWLDDTTGDLYILYGYPALMNNP